MTSPRQIDANRRNAQLSTGPVTAEGKQRSRRNAIRHGLTAETIIDALEDAEDYAAFEMAVTADFEATSAVERELVLRLAGLCGGCVVPLRSRAACSRSRPGVFCSSGRHDGSRAQAPEDPRWSLRRAVVEPRAREMETAEDEREMVAPSKSSSENTHDLDDLTRSYIRLANLPTCPWIGSSAGTRQHYGARLVRSYSRYSS